MKAYRHIIVLQKNLPLFQPAILKKWGGQIVKDYYVFGTPTFYLLNSKREIILRPTTTAQLDAWVDWVLVQGNK